MALNSARSYRSTGGHSIQARDPTGVLRRTARRIARSEVNAMMSRVVGVSDERVVEDTVDSRARATTMRRVIVKNVEVPVKRQVKVPVKTTKIVPSEMQQRVLVKRLVEVPGFKEVDEEYTTVEHRSVMRDKEVWVKKVVQEEVMEPYEVRRTRKKRVPTSSLKEVEEWQEVTVTTDQAVEQDGFRVDEVEDTKLLEVKEEQLYELVPRLKDERILMSARDLGLQVRDHHLTRHMGTRTYNAREVRDIAIDEFPADTEVVSVQVRHMRQRLGMVVSQLRSEHRGVRIKLIRSGYPCEKSGLRAGDVITHVDGAEVHTLDSFRHQVYKSGKTITFTIIRGTATQRITVTKRLESDSSMIGATRSYGASGGSPLRAAGGEMMMGGGGTTNYESHYQSSSYATKNGHTVDNSYSAMDGSYTRNNDTGAVTNLNFTSLRK